MLLHRSMRTDSSIFANYRATGRSLASRALAPGAFSRVHCARQAVVAFEADLIADHVIINRLGGEPVRAAADDHLQPEISGWRRARHCRLRTTVQDERGSGFRNWLGAIRFERLPEAECTVCNRELGPDRKPPSSQTRSIAFQDCVLSRTPWARPTNSFELNLITQLAPALGAAAIELPPYPLDGELSTRKWQGSHTNDDR